MNNHGSLIFWTVYRPVHAGMGNEVFMARKWMVTGRHIHNALSGVMIEGTLEAIRQRIKEDAGDLPVLNVGAHMDDADNVVEMWVMSWGDDVRRPDLATSLQAPSETPAK